jgi:hypothetical protein
MTRSCLPPSCGGCRIGFRDLERLLGRKTMENEILKEALELAGGK